MALFCAQVVSMSRVPYWPYRTCIVYPADEIELRIEGKDADMAARRVEWERLNVQKRVLQGEVGALGATHAGSFGVPHAVVIELFRLRKVLSMVEDMEEWVNSLLAADEWEAAWLRHMRARFMANEYSGLIDG